MSTAIAFQNRIGFLPFTISSIPSFYDYVDVTPEQAVALYWALEDFQIVTTCTATPANINWTTTFGATESMPFTAGGGGGFNTRNGAYYVSTTPASPPAGRVVNSSNGSLISLLAEELSGGTTKRIKFDIFLRESPTAGMIRIIYQFNFRHISVPKDCLIMNPSNSITKSGTPPSSGTFTILGISFSWIGGGSTSNTNLWTTETATVSATSSAFTF